MCFYVCVYTGLYVYMQSEHPERLTLPCPIVRVCTRTDTRARTLTPVAPTVHAGATLEAAVGPPEDRWIPDSARAAAVTVRLTARSAPPDATCVTEHEGPLGAAPPAAIPLSVPADFCPGPAWLSLSGSQRRSAVRACPPGVGCRFEMSGFLAPIDVLPPVEAPTTPLPSPPI